MSAGDRTSLRRRVGRAIGLAAVVLAPIHRLVLQQGFVLQHEGFASDLIHNQFPYRAFQGGMLRQGHFPLWMPDVFSGVPFLAQIEAGPLFLPNAVLFTLFDPYTALNLAISLTFLLGGAGMYRLCRSLGADAHGALLGGFVFAYCGFNVSHVKHMNMHEAAALLPWLLWCLEKALGDPRARYRLGLAAGLALQLFAGHPQVTYISLLLMGTRVIAHLFGRARAARRAGDAIPWRRLAGQATGLAAAVALGLGLAGVQLLPTWAFNASSMRGGELGWDYAARFPYSLPDLLTFVAPEATGTLARADYTGTIEWENYAYCGLTGLALALFAVLRGHRRRLVLFYAGVALLALLLALGPATPLYRALWELLPGLKLFRFPTRFMLAVHLALALLAAIGSSELARLVSQRWKRDLHRAVGLTLLLLVFADLAYWQMRRIPIDDVDAWRPPGPIANAIRELEPPGRVATLATRRTWMQAMQQSLGFQRGFEPYREAGWRPLLNYAVLKGLHNASGYTNMVSTRCGAFWQEYNRDLLSEVHQRKPYDPETRTLTRPYRSLLDRAHVRSVVSPMPLDGGDLELVSADLGLYRNPTALPRAYLAARWQPTSSLRESARWMLGKGAGHSEVPAIEGAGPPEPGASGIRPVALALDTPDRLELSLPDDAQGWLVVTDSYDPGWTARVDGQPVQIRIANGYQRAIEVPPGARRVELRYWPEGLTAGLTVSAASAFALLAWAAFSLRARANRPD